jgi:hypothetical protein
VSASEVPPPTEKKDSHPIWGLLIMEGFLVTNAWMASEDPSGYGGFLALVAPISGCEFYCSGLIAAESIAIYNMSIDENKNSKSEIFKNNMIAWHVFAAVGGVASYFIDDEDIKLSFKPSMNSGGNLVFNYRF